MPLRKKLFCEDNAQNRNFSPRVSCIAHHVQHADEKLSCKSKKNDYTEILICAKGTSTIYIGDTNYNIAEGDIAVINSNVINYTVSNSNDYEFYSLGISGYSYPGFNKNTLYPDDEPVFSSGIYKKQLIYLFNEMFKEAIDDEILFTPILSAWANLIVIEVMKVKQYIDVKDLSNVGCFIEKVKKYIEYNYSDDLSLNDLANVGTISKSYLSHEFKKSVGVGPIDYLSNIRINVAKRLLSTSNIPIKDISEQVGFKNPAYFTSVFKKATGVTPNQYRNSSKNKP